MEEKPDPLIQRIFVALDASTQSDAALAAAVDMAAALQARLVGIFVEDINLLRAAQLPFVKEVRFSQAEVREINQQQMEQHWRLLASQVHYNLSELAREKQVEFEFEVLRGSVASRLLAAVLEADLLALGRLGRSLLARTRLGSTARLVVSQARSSVLLMHDGGDLTQPVLIFYDDTPAAKRALAVAVQLTPRHGRLRVLIWTEDDAAALEFRRQIIEQIHAAEIDVSFRRLYPHEQSQLAHDLDRTPIGLLVIGKPELLLTEDTLAAILEELDIPVLIVR